MLLKSRILPISVSIAFTTLAVHSITHAAKDDLNLDEFRPSRVSSSPHIDKELHDAELEILYCLNSQNVPKDLDALILNPFKKQVERLRVNKLTVKLELNINPFLGGEDYKKDLLRKLTF